MNFQQFKQAGKRDVPNLIAAQNADDKIQQQIDAIKMQNIGSTVKGGGELYNTAMGDKSPIADYLFGTEPSGQFAMEDIGYALPEAAGVSSGMNSAALTEALRAPALEATANGMNLGAALAPEAAAAALPAGEAALAASLGEIGLAAPAAATAGLNASTLGAALAPAAAEIGVGGAAAAGAGAAMPPLGIAMLLAGLLGPQLFG